MEIKPEENPSVRIRRIERRIFWFSLFAYLFAVLGFFAAVPAVWRLFHEQGDRFSLANLSSIGSYLQGAVASLWSLASFLLIYVAFLGQKQQLLYQEAQIVDQQKQFHTEATAREREAKDAHEKFELQQTSIKKQQFEHTFFQLLNLQNQIVLEMSVSLSHSTYTGRDCFRLMFNELHSFLDAIEPIERYKEMTDHRSYVSKKYEGLYESHQAALGHYFRNLYHIFKFVNTSDIGDKRRYTSLARAQLSQFEVYLLFFNGISSFGDKFKPIIEKFGLLENLNKTLLPNTEYLKFYAESAYE